MTGVVGALETRGGLSQELSDRIEEMVAPIRTARDLMRHMGGLMTRSKPLPDGFEALLELMEGRAVEALPMFKALLDQAFDEMVRIGQHFEDFRASGCKAEVGRVTNLGPKYAHLKALIERCAERAEGSEALSEAQDLRSRLIVSLQECAQAAMALADQLGDVACPREAACLHRGDWDRCNACFNEQTDRLFGQAGKLLASAMLSMETVPRVRAQMARASKPCEASPQRAASLTEAQQRVFDLLMTGLPNKSIAYEIGISEATVRAHVSAVLQKMKVRSRTQAIALSYALNQRRGEQSPDLLS